MVRDGPSGLPAMRLRPGHGLILSLSKDEERRRCWQRGRNLLEYGSIRKARELSLGFIAYAFDLAERGLDHIARDV
jgi:hypothetical protein